MVQAFEGHVISLACEGTFAKFPDLRVVYIGRDTWDTEVLEPMRDLQPEQATVPGDGHFGPGTHGLIAAMIDRAMARHCESCLQE